MEFLGRKKYFLKFCMHFIQLWKFNGILFALIQYSSFNSTRLLKDKWFSIQHRNYYKPFFLVNSETSNVFLHSEIHFNTSSLQPRIIPSKNQKQFQHAYIFCAMWFPPFLHYVVVKFSGNKNFKKYFNVVKILWISSYFMQHEWAFSKEKNGAAREIFCKAELVLILRKIPQGRISLFCSDILKMTFIRKSIFHCAYEFNIGQKVVSYVA